LEETLERHYDGKRDILNAVDSDILRDAVRKQVKLIKSDELIDKECKPCIQARTKMIFKKDGVPIVFDEIEQDLLIDWIEYFFNL
jgi:hypothetical protein